MDVRDFFEKAKAICEHYSDEECPCCPLDEFCSDGIFAMNSKQAESVINIVKGFDLEGVKMSVPEKWLQWKNAREWGNIFCPMLASEVMTYYPIGGPAYDSYTAPFVDSDGDVYYYKFDHDEGAWDESLIWAGEFEDGMRCILG